MGTAKVLQRSFSRREFLKRSRQAGIGAMVFALGDGALRRAQGAAAPVREFTLATSEGTWELAPGRVTRSMSYNNQVPGPEIRVKEGEQLRVRLRNHLREPTSIHFHGIDEVPTPTHPHGIPMMLDAPGESRKYEFSATPAGTRWYHPTHRSGAHQFDFGLSGPLIVEPAGPEPFPFDREYTLLFDDWATGTGRPLPGTWEGTAVGGVGGGMGGMMSGMCGGMGMMDTRMRGPLTPPYDTMTINGKVYPATQPLTVRKGERVRLRLINPSSYHTHVIRLAGHRLGVTHTDGNPLLEPVEVDALPIAPAERYDVLVVADQPGGWLLYCAQPGHSAAGEQVLVLYEEQETKPEPPVEGLAGLRVWHYALGRGRDVLPAPTGRWSNFNINLMGMPDTWMINGKRDPTMSARADVPRTDRLRVARGDGVRVRFINMSPQSHPMHLHGQRFKVVEVNGHRLASPLVKDVVDVHAHMGTALIEITAQFPGDWMFHCHKEPHAEGGMLTFLMIG